MAGDFIPRPGGFPPADSGGAASKSTNRSWSSIASLNISKRNKTNTIEVRLENDQGTGCSLNIEETERLLRRLKIESKQFTSVQACPERKNVVYITLCNGVDMSKFIMNNNESFILKPGVRTTTIKHVSKREVNVQVFGLHPDTKDDAVIRYLNAHGQVSSKDPVIYGVYPGAPGSSLLAGKRNGNRIYSVEVKKNIGSTHIIDGEKVSIRYTGQMKTCNKCHKDASICPGKGLAKDCTAQKVLLSQHMLDYWNYINFKPETTNMNDEVDIEENDEPAEKTDTINQVKTVQQKVSLDNNLASRYGGVVVKGFKKGIPLDDIIDTLKEAGVPLDYGKEDLQTMEKFEHVTIYIHDLKPETCVEIVNNLHGQEKHGQRISVYTLVEDTPTKKSGEDLEKLLEDEHELDTSKHSDIMKVIHDATKVPQTPVTPIDPTNSSASPISGMTSRFWNIADNANDDDESSENDLEELREQFRKRKAEGSPANNEFETVLTKKEKKKLKNSLNKSK